MSRVNPVESGAEIVITAAQPEVGLWRNRIAATGAVIALSLLPSPAEAAEPQNNDTPEDVLADNEAEAPLIEADSDDVLADVDDDSDLIVKSDKDEDKGVAHPIKEDKSDETDPENEADKADSTLNDETYRENSKESEDDDTITTSVESESADDHEVVVPDLAFLLELECISADAAYQTVSATYSENALESFNSTIREDGSPDEDTDEFDQAVEPIIFNLEPGETGEVQFLVTTSSYKNWAEDGSSDPILSFAGDTVASACGDMSADAQEEEPVVAEDEQEPEAMPIAPPEELDELPETGQNTGRLALGGLALVALGGTVLGSTRRRPRGNYTIA